jgi:hypothetical protein
LVFVYPLLHSQELLTNEELDGHVVAENAAVLKKHKKAITHKV